MESAREIRIEAALTGWSIVSSMSAPNRADGSDEFESHWLRMSSGCPIQSTQPYHSEILVSGKAHAVITELK
jgi:hypothetical protein